MNEHEITVEGGTSVLLPTAGTYCDKNIVITATGGSSDENQLDARLQGTLKELSSTIPSVTQYACYGLASLVKVNLPNATTLGAQAFRACTKLTSFNAPNVTSITTYAFYTCSGLPAINLPLVSSIPNNSFEICSKLAKADFGAAASIGTNAFGRCTVLTALILRKSDSITTLANTNAFTSTPIASGTGYIYVPKTLIDSYKTAANWSTYAAQFRAIEDYPDICG